MQVIEAKSITRDCVCGVTLVATINDIKEDNRLSKENYFIQCPKCHRIIYITPGSLSESFLRQLRKDC